MYVDQLGNPVSTATETIMMVPASPAPAPAPTSTTSPTKAAATAAKAVPSPVSDESPSVSKLSSPDMAASTAGSSSQLHGVTYSPYKGAGGCKTPEQVDADFALFAKDHGVVRLYGVDCDQVANAYAAAKKYGNKLFLGIYDIGSVSQAVSTIAEGVKNDWAIVDTVSVGNELVNSGAASVPQVLAAVGQARSALRAAGYQGPVVTVDTFVAATSNPDLCNQSDYCAVNVHPFFDANTGAPQAGKFVTDAVARLRAKLADSGKRIVVTETGWPWQGNANGAAVPGKDTQTAALSSIKSSFSSNPADCILFTAFNDMWKKPAIATFNAEQFWGMDGRYSPADGY